MRNSLYLLPVSLSFALSLALSVFVEEGVLLEVLDKAFADLVERLDTEEVVEVIRRHSVVSRTILEAFALNSFGLKFLTHSQQPSK